MSDQLVAETSIPDNTQHSQQKNIHAAGRIRTHNLSRRAAVVLRLRPRGHWDRHGASLHHVIIGIYCHKYKKKTCLI